MADPDERYRRGLRRLVEVDGPGEESFVKAMGDLGRYVVESPSATSTAARG